MGNKEQECKAVWKQAVVEMWIKDVAVGVREIYSQGERLMHFSTLCCKSHVNAEWLRRRRVRHTGAFRYTLLNWTAGMTDQR